MQRTFLTNLALVLVLNLLVKPFYILGIDAGVQQAVGAEVYGGYAALLSLGFLLNIVLDLGMTNYNTRHIAQHTHLMGKYVGGVVAMRGGLMLVYALLTFGSALVLGYSGADLGMLGWLVLNQILVATILYLRSNIAGAQRYRWDSFLSVLDRLLLIAGVGWLLWGRASGTPFRIEWFVQAQTAAYTLTAVTALVFVRRLSGPLRMNWMPAFSWVVLKHSAPFALLILLMTFYYRIDTLMLERLLPDGAEQAGIYYQGFRFFEALNMLGYLVAGLLLPMLSRMLVKREDVSPIITMSLRLVLMGSLAVAVFGGFNARELIGLLYTEHVDSSSSAFALLVWCFVGVCITYVFGTLLTAAGELRWLNWTAAGGAVLNIGLNLVLIPRWQVQGAAMASLITQVVTALVQMAIATKVHHIVGLRAVVLRGVAYSAGLIATAFALRAAEVPLIPSLGVFGLGAIAAAVLFKLLVLSEIRVALTRGEA